MNPDFILINIPVILFALTIHEYSHALIASRLGDDTARQLGRLTMNPIKHLDIFGTILMVLVGFGWAKPVPVDTRNLQNPKKDMLFIALAGPASNLILALISGLSIRYFAQYLVTGGSILNFGIIFQVLTLTLVYNTALAVFNLLPVPPLDGSRIIYGLLPRKLENPYRSLEPFGIIILFGLFIFGQGVFSRFLWYPVSAITQGVSGINLMG